MSIGSCIAAGYSECCKENNCVGSPIGSRCYCDQVCSSVEDCCLDVAKTCSPAGMEKLSEMDGIFKIDSVSITAEVNFLPAISLGVTPGVQCVTVPYGDDRASHEIPINGGFSIGSTKLYSAYVCNIHILL